jgi:fatty-acyl-CoA synthase
VVTALAIGSKLVFGPPRFDVERTLSIIEREKITSWMAIPTLLQRVVNHPNVERYDTSSLLFVSTGGAPTAPETAARAQQVFQTQMSLATSYGLTETHGMATSIGGDEYMARKNSVGKPMPVVEVRIVNDKHEPVAVGVPGHVLIGGTTVTPGYWRRPQETAQTVIDGWLHTGDIGYLDAEGYLYISDRAKDMVIRGGENVYPREIEEFLFTHPAVEQAAVVGLPDPKYGEELCAWIKLKSGQTATADDIRAFCRGQLAHFKVPRYVKFVDSFPQTVTGKIQKFKIRESMKEELGLAEQKTA